MSQPKTPPAISDPVASPKPIPAHEVDDHFRASEDIQASLPPGINVPRDRTPIQATNILKSLLSHNAEGLAEGIKRH